MPAIPHAHLPTAQVKRITLAALKERLNCFTDGTPHLGGPATPDPRRHHLAPAAPHLQRRPANNSTQESQAMNLTIPQMTLLKTCVYDEMRHMEKAAAISTREDSKAFWLAHAEAARQLLAILDAALFISVESANLTPQGEACGDIHCDGKHCITPATAAAHPLREAEGLSSSPFPVEVLKATAFETLPEEELGKHLHSLQQSLLREPSAAGSSAALEGWVEMETVPSSSLSTDPAPLHAEDSTPQKSEASIDLPPGSSGESKTEGSPLSQPSSLVSSDSSAEPSQEAAPYKPALLAAIDLTESLEEALDLLSTVNVFARTLVANHLGLPPDQLTDAITRRVRARLLASL